MNIPKTKSTMNKIYNFSGFLIGKIFRYRSEVVTQNLARSLPLSNYSELSYQYQHFYRNMSRIILEVLFPNRPQLIISSEMYRTLHQIHQQQRNIILMLGHYGNWEILGKLPLHLDIPIQSLYKPVKNKWINRLLLNRRQQYGVQLLPADQAAKKLLGYRSSPAITLFIADQFPGKGNGLEIDFLSQSTHMFMGPERIARRIDAYVAYIELRPIDTYKWKAYLHPISTHAAKSTVGQITRSFTRKLESSILQDPTWWLWSHKRWK